MARFPQEGFLSLEAPQLSQSAQHMGITLCIPATQLLLKGDWALCFSGTSARLHSRPGTQQVPEK